MALVVITAIHPSSGLTLSRLLKGHDSRRLEAQVGLEVLRYLAHKSLERELADEKVR